jgi:hypothetical protein
MHLAYKIGQWCLAGYDVFAKQSALGDCHYLSIVDMAPSTKGKAIASKRTRKRTRKTEESSSSDHDAAVKAKKPKFSLPVVNAIFTTTD